MSQGIIKGIQYRSEKMIQINHLVHSLIPLESNLTIIGLAGTGKTTWANYIMEASQLSGKYMYIDVKELDEDRFKEILARNTHRHIVIENIEFLHKENQAVLAQYIQKNGITAKPVILTTSSRSLTELAQQGLLRQDLYYKLTVFKVELPTLKETIEDISVLAAWYVQQFGQNYKKNDIKLTHEAIEKLNLYFWPGNISELESVIERAVILSNEMTITDKHIRFDEFQKHSALDLSLGMSLSEVERRLILQTLEHTENNRTKAAHILGISIRTLRNKLNEYKEAGLI